MKEQIIAALKNCAAELEDVYQKHENKTPEEALEASSALKSCRELLSTLQAADSRIGTDNASYSPGWDGENRRYGDRRSPQDRRRGRSSNSRR